ncbi:2-hydroxyacyl-CoA dehydratase [Anaerocolumna sp. MB42-C2]|uniref:2-hydroxyacyl-CoA dehydratase n=1 Tax=Anaerocolumna sp. MB42-C2 TaxID=3070997 RepID=UPI0027E008EA|nr:2-hydroxyacyl-CoA dehydratase [Anaerocolumna sp. MB42-C2]WMJ88115.1 acyl-CoA dehydratase activase-related protein [Anaerocolumna sp. MB42-C2]
MSKYKIGLDIGSTTVKIAVLDEDNRLIYSDYKRHLSDIKSTIISIINTCYKELGDIKCTISITGSGGLSVSEWLKIPFEQEVVSCTKTVKSLIPEVDVVIELGGEDAKITYLKNGLEQRMNNSCAGGTGAFIDQMAVLLNTDAAGLNEYAKKHKVIYPIASRCGVFAKTDIQPLLNDGAGKEDIAVSIFQAVVNQTIGGLACGKPIRGKVAFLGGPLYFLPELRERFIVSLNLAQQDAIIPENGILYPAIGAALLSGEKKITDTQQTDEVSLKLIIEKVHGITNIKDNDVRNLPPLFKTEEEYQIFKERHNHATIKRAVLSEYQGNTFLGVDAGSTTTKAALISENGELLYSYYGSNEGEPIKKVIWILNDLYNRLPKGIRITRSTVTGYGEGLMKAALHIDYGEIETIAHYKAAEYFLPGVDFILDIGGQDMKCLRIKNNTIDSILLNEACSSGCGSFLEGFAASLNMSVEQFAKAALFAKSPVDLGTKCTVFMNSKVKQAQKEGAAISDLSAGLSYSVIKNVLFKVIKIRDEKDMGKKMIVQGGTFYNDAVLRCFEMISGREVVRPDIAGLMGAFGAALIAKERFIEESEELVQKGVIASGNQIFISQSIADSALLSRWQLSGFETIATFKRCEKCGNHCLLTVNRFSNGESFVSGNRCERGLGTDAVKAAGSVKMPNLYEYKYQKTFAYKPLSLSKAKRGIIGIPRTLNMYDNYPFWFTLFTKLEFRVELSSPSNKIMYEKGLGTIPSESVCYPAKLSHGHIFDLIERDIHTIFYPSIVFEKKEYEDVDNHYNCPIVISYSEVIKNNIDELHQIKFIAPFLSMNDDKILAQRMTEVLSDYAIPLSEVKKAVNAARTVLESYKLDIQKKGEEVIEFLKKNHKKGIVLCGKPYHIDPEVHHGIPGLINSFGMAVLTEDSISHLTPLKNKLRVVDQWTYNSRLYRAAAKVAEEPNLELIQLNSFGCGLDSVTSDQIAEILASGGKIYTMLKIDEGNNLGAAKIRIRSLKAAIEERDKRVYQPAIEDMNYATPIFTKEKRKVHTILVPQLSPVHFDLIKEAARSSDYQFEILPGIDQAAVDEGLKYVNNDACYPAILIIGQIVHALKSGKYDVENTSVIISQTGGGCRATNYMAFLKLGLKQAGFENIPIISLNAVGLGEQPGFKLSIRFINKCIMALIYGDLFMRVLYGSRPYEVHPGSSEALYRKWNELVKDNIRNGNKREFDHNIKNIVREFDQLEVTDIKKPKVAIVGEILAKYHPMANNGIISSLEEGGAEVVLPDLLDFLLYCLFNSEFKFKYLGGKRIKKNACEFSMVYLDRYRKVMKVELEKSKRFSPPTPIHKLANMASSVLSLGNQTGEGWLITAEMIECIESGINNILCVQPLACLPNHITGRGMFKPLKEKYPMANIMPIDYDPGISHVNQLNRIKLMLSVALKNI